MIYVLDASSVLRYTDNEPGADRVEELLRRAAKGDHEILISALNWGEIVGVLFRNHGLLHARKIAHNLLALPITVAPVDAAAAEAAGMFRENFKVPYADSFAGSLTLLYSAGQPKDQAVLVTADFDFKSVPKGTVKIEYLPKK
jgi:predicted nucleic acid-binding protein